MMSETLNLSAADEARILAELEATCPNLASYIREQWTARDDLQHDVANLRQALRDVQWKKMRGRPSDSLYPTCVGCGVIHGRYGGGPHSPDCIIENALKEVKDDGQA